QHNKRKRAKQAEETLSPARPADHRRDYQPELPQAFEEEARWAEPARHTARQDNRLKRIPQGHADYSHSEHAGHRTHRGNPPSPCAAAIANCGSVNCKLARKAKFTLHNPQLSIPGLSGVKRRATAG